MALNIRNRKILLFKSYFPKRSYTVKHEALQALEPEENSTIRELDPATLRASSRNILNYLTNELGIKKVVNVIPIKYFALKRWNTPSHLYLVDQKVAKNIVNHVLPFLSNKQLICETNAGLGFVASELLKQKVKKVRLYESCIDFRTHLKQLNSSYRDRIELFTRDIFHLSFLSYVDRQDSGNRVEQMFKKVNKRKWKQEPVMTVIGTMQNLSFINYLIKSIILQQEAATYGRIQIFALIKPRHYVRLTADRSMTLKYYQVQSVLFQLFFELQLIDKYPRKSFLPWETKRKESPQSTYTKEDAEYIYLTRMQLKKDLPTKIEHLKHFYHFVKQGFFRGRPRVIPTIEKWLPDCSADLIAPFESRKNESFPHMNIYTQFRELTPQQILEIFLIMSEHPQFKSSPLHELVDSELMKSETINCDMENIKYRFVNLEERLSGF